MKEESHKHLAGRRVVVSMSGGKDSGAVALYLREIGIPFDAVFADTGWEAGQTYEYLEYLERTLGMNIHRVRGSHTFESLAASKGMFPSRLIRFCTVELKIKPLQAFLNDRASEYELVNAVGIRRAESQARRRMLEWEWCEGFDCETWRPIVEWTEEDVIKIHQRNGVRPNPLYLMGAKRVGCWPCINASKAELRLLGEIDPDRVERLRELEARVVGDARARAEARGEELTRPPAMFQLRAGTGANSFVPLDRVLAWARTSRGGKQVELFRDPDGNACMRWGMCDP